jgi:hypothetical protein
MAIEWRSFVISGKSSCAVIPKELLRHVRLSELPDGIGVNPSGLSIAVAAGEQVDCWLYGFQDGYAFARIQITTKAGPRARLRALQDAIRERQEEQDDVELTDSDQPEHSGLCFLMDFAEDITVPEALERVECVLQELDSRRLGLLTAQPFRRSAAR